jgi:hypothetical protein
MEENLKLYRVTLQGMKYNSSGVTYGISYVIAENSDIAYQKIRKFLDENNIGFVDDREMDKVELIGDTQRYNSVKTMLFL